jgi:aspartate aminotransferase-like enzyme
MALIPATIQQQMTQAIKAALDTAMPEGVKADPSSHQKLAAAIAQGVTTVMVTALTTQAQVMPGIVTAGSPATQTSTTPGKIV